ncbi:hypothetical protein R4P64_24035 [Rhodococcus sp. IEGM 1366]|uniref:hypothetical protein n=1 Tax=Rhodococcus sp. IEGM 1366 TaxID=3082223 RepID=UPI0029539CE3|nr:hypothetical protein [Rhodococcus sp. IEGM 1366]MDV8069603.1 hypothetical protein [Rhodococcus sp. IEGM 1366]
MNTPLPQVMSRRITHLLTTDFDSRTLLESITGTNQTIVHRRVVCARSAGHGFNRRRDRV